jgi:hypothetical protein
VVINAYTKRDRNNSGEFAKQIRDIIAALHAGYKVHKANWEARLGRTVCV